MIPLAIIALVAVIIVDRLTVKHADRWRSALRLVNVAGFIVFLGVLVVHGSAVFSNAMSVPEAERFEFIEQRGIVRLLLVKVKCRDL